MAAYLFQLELPEMVEEIATTIPLHREYVNKLFADGHMLSYSVSMQRSTIWCVMNADSEQEAMEMVIAFPLYKYFTDISCHALLFHNMLPESMPGISLN